jgi:hypothetical protein
LKDRHILLDTNAAPYVFLPSPPISKALKPCFFN